eukprot:IDg17430t1
MQDDVHKSQYIASIARAEIWAALVLTQSLTKAMNYHAFYTMLVAVATQQSLSESASIPITAPYSQKLAYTTYHGSTYAQNPRRNTGKRSPKHQTRQNRTLKELQELQRRTHCLRC